MNFRYLPAIMTLTAALITSIVTIVYKYNTTKALVYILCVILFFSVIGNLCRSVLNRFLVAEKETENIDEQIQNTGTADTADGQNAGAGSAG